MHQTVPSSGPLRNICTEYAHFSIGKRRRAVQRSTSSVARRRRLPSLGRPCLVTLRAHAVKVTEPPIPTRALQGWVRAALAVRGACCLHPPRLHQTAPPSHLPRPHGVLCLLSAPSEAGRNALVCVPAWPRPSLPAAAAASLTLQVTLPPRQGRTR